MNNGERIKNLIVDKISKLNRHPFLFVGSGLTKRYLETETWEDLLKHLITHISENSLKYSEYANEVKGLIEDSTYTKFPKIASLLENDYNRAVFKDEKFEYFRKNHIALIEDGISPFKIAISENFKKISNQEFKLKDEIELINKMAIRNVSGIITTNYDTFLENIFKDYKVYVGQEELIFSELHGSGEIYKIHGCVEQPQSIVITSDDYDKFMKKSPYLVAKILTIFLEYPIIFLGYSISDKNIYNILESISTCLNSTQLDKLKERFIFVEYDPNEEDISRHSISFKNNTTIEMTKIKTSNFTPIYEGVNGIQARYNPKILRQLKKEIYLLAESTNPTSKIYATGFENLDTLEENGRYVVSIGVNTSRGVPIKAKDIYKDIVYDNQYLDSNLVIKHYLPELLKNNSGGLPMYKYIKDFPELVKGRIKEEQEKRKSIDDFFNSALKKGKTNYRKGLENKTIAEIRKKEGNKNLYKKIYFLEEDEINLSELEKYLKEIFKQNELDSELRRLIRIYDWLKYR